jgi:hypothetical protein
MAVYGYSEPQIETMISKAGRVRSRFFILGIIVLAVVGLLMAYRPALPLFHEPLRGWFFAILTSVFLIPISSILRNWRTWPNKMRLSLRAYRIEISPGAVGMAGPQEFKREFSIREIVRTEEPSLGTGLYVRTSNRYRWIVIPRRLAGYEAIKQELGAVGVSVVRTTIPPNWEEFAGMLLFATTAICSFAVHNIRALSVNLLVALLLSVGWYFVINANPDVLKLPRMRWARFGAFLPVVFAAVGLWFALHG